MALVRTAGSWMAPLATPFAVYWWMLPYLGERTFNNDYLGFSIVQQQTLLFALLNGTFPLYTPGFAGGNTASALTLGQLYHPVTALAALLPGYWDGRAVDANTLAHLLGLGLAHLLLFRMLRRLGVQALWAYFLSLVVVHNQRSVDLFRYGSALETYTGFLLLVVSTIWCLEGAPWRRALLAIAGSTYWTISSGHSQMA